MKNLKIIRNISAIILMFLVAWNGLLAQPVLPEQSNPTKLIHDLAQFMSPIDVATLERDLRAYDDSTSSEIAILTIQTLDGYPLDDYALEVFNKWKIGERGKNNGVLILVAQKERKVKIQVGSGIGQKLTATRCAQIIDQRIVPAFKQRAYAQGLREATQTIRAIANGEFKNDNRGKKSGDGWVFLAIVLGLVLLFFYISYKAQRQNIAQYGTRPRRYRREEPTIFWGGGFGGGGFGGGGGDSGGSSWGGFGGGESDGGGASGDW